MSSRVSLPRIPRGRLLAVAALLLSLGRAPSAHAAPYVPGNDDTVLAELSAGTRFADVSARRLARARIDVAIPLAQFYIQQSRPYRRLAILGICAGRARSLGQTGSAHT